MGTFLSRVVSPRVQVRRPLALHVSEQEVVCASWEVVSHAVRGSISMPATSCSTFNQRGKRKELETSPFDRTRRRLPSLFLGVADGETRCPAVSGLLWCLACSDSSSVKIDALLGFPRAPRSCFQVSKPLRGDGVLFALTPTSHPTSFPSSRVFSDFPEVSRAQGHPSWAAGGGFWFLRLTRPLSLARSTKVPCWAWCWRDHELLPLCSEHFMRCWWWVSLCSPNHSDQQLQTPSLHPVWANLRNTGTCSCYQKSPEGFVFASTISTFSFTLGGSFVHSTDLKYNLFVPFV